MKKGKLLLAALMLTVATSAGTLAAACSRDEHVHNWGEWSVSTAPTQSSPGEATRNCKDNDGSETLPLPALSDSEFWTKDDAAGVAPSHTQEGKDVYKNDEHDITVEVPLQKTPEHNYGEWKVTKDPTQTEPGNAERTCTANDEGKEQKELPALTDSFWTLDATASQAATHTDPGKNVYKNAEYNLTVEETVPAVGHQWGSWTITQDPTKTATGLAERTCEDDDNGKDQKELPALTDSFWTLDATASQDATHTDPGKNVYKNAEYNLTVEETVPAAGHQWGSWTITKDPTLTEKGKAKHVCVDDDGGEEEIEIANLGDATVWTPGETKDTADYESGAYTDYTSVYGTVRHITAGKLVAPFDGKTYYSFNVDTSSDTGMNKEITDPGSWIGASITLDANGEGTGTAHPFNGHLKFVLKDAETGEVEVTETRNETVTTYKGFVDMDTGVIVMPNNTSFNNVHVLIAQQFASGTDTLSASAFTVDGDYKMAISYTVGGTTSNIFLQGAAGNSAHFGVEFKDVAGDALLGGKAYNAPVFYVYDGQTKLAAYGYKEGTGVVVLDGKEGHYTVTGDDGADLYLSGFGTAEYTKGDQKQTGMYELAEEGSEYTLGLTLDGVYYEATITDKACTLDLVNVTLKFSVGGYAENIDDEEVAPLVEYQLPTPTETNDKFIFDGWYLDEGFEEAAPSPYIPRTDATLYAKWADAVTVTVKKDDKDEGTSLKAKVGALWLDLLENIVPAEEQKDTQNGLYLYGWNISDGEHSLDINEATAVSADHHGATVTGVWHSLDVYVGDYFGIEVYGKSSKSSRNSFNLSISTDGAMTSSDNGFNGGKVEQYSYDNQTQMFNWTKGTASNHFFIESDYGILVINYSSKNANYFGYDFYIFARGAQSDPVKVNYGINALIPGSTGTIQNYYLQFLTVTTEKGDVDMLLYYNRIYAGITMKDTSGKTLSIADLKTSKTVLVSDSAGNLIGGWASTTDTFDSSSAKTVVLDSYFGSYNDGELVLDGAGAITYKGVAGTYTVEDGQSYTISAYVGEGDEQAYYEITLNKAELSATVVKPMVTVTFSTAHGERAEAQYNKNIQAKIAPMGDVDGFVFRGWSTDEEFEDILETDAEGNYLYTPTAAATLYAKWLTEYTLTIHYNDATSVEEQTVVIHYGEGEIAEVTQPTKTGRKFGGWYTTSNFAEDTKWTPGSAITANTEIWAKWDDAPAYSNTYKLYYYDNEKPNGEVESATTYTGSVVIDAEGNVPHVSSTVYPFSSNDLQVKEYDEATGKIIFLRVGYSTEFTAYFDTTSKIMAFICRGSDFGDMLIMVPAEFAATATVTNSYWASGTIRAITVASEDVSYNIFLNVDKAYFNVKFAADKQGTDPVAAEEAYTAHSLYVLSSTNEILGSFGYNGTTMVTRDGFEGTYTKGAGAQDLGSLVLDGVGGVTFGDGKSGSYEVTSKPDSAIEIYELAEDVKTAYYTATIDISAGTYSAEKPMVTITFNSAYGFENDGAKTAQYNKNIPITLPNLTDDNYIFNGWFKDAAYGTALSLNVDGTFTPVDATTTIYVQWLEKLTVNVVWGKDNIQLPTEYFVGKGNTLTLELPGYTDGEVVDGLYTDASFATPWENGSKVEAGFTVYVKWMQAVPMYGTYTGKNVMSSYSGTGSNKLTVNADGSMSGNLNASSSTYDPLTGKVVAGNYQGAFDAYSGIIYFAYSSNTDPATTHDVNVYVPSSSFKITGGASFASNNINKLFAVEGSDGYSTTILIWNGRIYGDVTIKSDANDVTVSNFTGHDAFSVWQGDKLIYNFKKSGSDWVASDGFENDYAKAAEGSAEDLGTLTLDGLGKITSAGAKTGEGKYSIADGKTGKIDVYYTVEGVITEYYEVTLDTSAKTYTATKPMVTVTYSITGGLTEEADVVNKNVPYALPATSSDTQIIDGWFTDSDCTNPVTLNGDGLYVPTGEVTLYAKAYDKVTVTLVWTVGGHSQDENTVLNLRKGVVPDLSDYANKVSADGFRVGSWYTNEDCAEEHLYTPAELTSSITLYCGWVKKEPFNITFTENSFVEDPAGTWKCVFGATAKTVTFTISFEETGTVSFDFIMRQGEGSYDSSYMKYNGGYLIDDVGQLYFWNYFDGDTTSGSNAAGNFRNTLKNIKVEAGKSIVITLNNAKSSSADAGDCYAQISNIQFTAS